MTHMIKEQHMVTDNRQEHDLAEMVDTATHARYFWQGQVWKPGNLVSVYSGMEPPEFVLAFRTKPGSPYTLERQAPAADGSSLWTWVDSVGLPVGEPHRPWHDALEGNMTLLVVRVKNDGPVGIGTALHEAAERTNVVRPEPLPFTPFPRPVPRPAEPEVGTVLGFSKKFDESGTSYSFAAIHAVQGRWYLSGPQYGGKSMRWDALLDFVGGPLDWARVGVVGSWNRLEDL